MSYTGLRIHPAIGIARVGNSEEYYLGPETMAGMDIPGKTLTGGVPIQPGTEGDTITSADLRDKGGKLKRQAARFRIYQYAFSDKDGVEPYPTGQGEEVKIGSLVDGKKVTDIIWTVHLANKKANSWLAGDGLASFQKNGMPDVRNPAFGLHLDDVYRIKKLVIDAGPRALNAGANATVHFDKATPASAYNPSQATITFLPDYPIYFPASESPADNSELHSRAITTLGSITTESNGRLIVLGGYGLACGFDSNGNYSSNAALNGNVNNDYWLDDTADGPVTAVLVFSDGSCREADAGAWVISADPAYAPQITNVVTLWDDLYCTWLENCGLQPKIYSNNHYQNTYQVNFSQEVYPVFRAASLQKWNTFLPARAIAKHDQVGQISADWNEFRIMNFIRDPNSTDETQVGSPLMPLSLGDADKSFLSPTKAQYFFLQQWAAGNYIKNNENQSLGAGEALDKTILFNCLGGRFSPGIEMSFIVRDINLYQQNWKRHSEGGPFRIRAKKLDYQAANKTTPFLGVGYIPLRDAPVEPGDVSKFMALPWHTDYNSCATHTPDPNPGSVYPRDKKVQQEEMQTLKANWDKGMPDFNTLLYSSWPAQRPVAVYTYDDVVANNYQLPVPRFSVRGAGTAVPDNVIEPAQLTAPSSWEFSLSAEQIGRYQDRHGILLNWHNIGMVMQAPAIAGKSNLLPQEFYLEVASGFDVDESNLAEPWPNTVIDKTYPPAK